MVCRFGKYNNQLRKNPPQWLLPKSVAKMRNINHEALVLQAETRRPGPGCQFLEPDRIAPIAASSNRRRSTILPFKIRAEDSVTFHVNHLLPWAFSQSWSRSMK